MLGGNPQQGTSLIFAATTLPAHARKSSGSCAELQAKYPKGLAKNTAGAQRAGADVYKTSYMRLDLDRDGVMCEAPA